MFRETRVFRCFTTLGEVLVGPLLSLSVRDNCGFRAEGDLLEIPDAIRKELTQLYQFIV